MMLIPIDGFPEVPLEVVEASGWVDVASMTTPKREYYCLGEQSCNTRG